MIQDVKMKISNAAIGGHSLSQRSASKGKRKVMAESADEVCLLINELINLSLTLSIRLKDVILTHMSMKRIKRSRQNH